MLLSSSSPSNQVYLSCHACPLSTSSIIIQCSTRSVSSLPSQSVLNLQTHWFQSQQLSYLCTFLSYFHCRPILISVLSNFVTFISQGLNCHESDNSHTTYTYYIHYHSAFANAIESADTWHDIMTWP